MEAQTKGSYSVKNEPTLERTLILLKPDAIERKLTGEILGRFERKGLSIVTANLVTPDEKLAKEHYQEHKNNEPYYGQMWGHLCSGPNLAVVLEGELAIKASRQLIGTQDPIHGSHVGTIRGDFGIQAPKNLVHGSDSFGSAKREIILWFGEEYVLKGKLVKEELAPGIFFEYDPYDHHFSVAQAKKEFMKQHGLGMYAVKPKMKKPPQKKVKKVIQPLEQWGPPIVASLKEKQFVDLVGALGDISVDVPGVAANDQFPVDITPMSPQEMLSILGVAADDVHQGPIPFAEKNPNKIIFDELSMVEETVGALDE